MSCFCSEEQREFNRTHKLLLLGASESGKSTVAKQMTILHVEGGFTDVERRKKAGEIRGNIRDIFLAILTAMKTFDPPIALNESNLDHAQYLKDYAERTLSTDECVFPPEFYERCVALWEDSGFQECYGRSDEYYLLDCANYFLQPEKLREISDPNYIPSNQDILYCRYVTRSIIQTDFSVGGNKFQIFDVGGQVGQRNKWILCFSDVTAIIFVVSCGSFNLNCREDSSKNQLVESIELFEWVWKNKWLQFVSVILFLNKQDQLRKKIKTGKLKIGDYFENYPYYSPPNHDTIKRHSEDTNETVKAKYFILDQFLEIPSHLPPNWPQRHVYPFFTTAVDTNNINRVFNTCKDITIRIHLEQAKQM